MRFNALARTILATILGSTLLGVWPPAGTAQAAEQSSAQQRPRISANYGTLPLTFEVNEGQTDSQVKFFSRGKGYTAFLTVGGMVLSLRPSNVAGAQTSAPVAGTKTATQGPNTSLQFKLVGATPNPTLVGEDPQPGRINYFIGNDPAKWHRNVPAYGRIRYQNVYPGIDLVYYGSQRQLEYDFIVSAGSDPRRIQFEIKGAKQIHLDAEGNLVLATGDGEVHFQSPSVYQESGGQQVPVSGSYILKDSTHVAFQLAPYNPGKRLVIDPVLLYSTYLGGSGNDQPSGIVVDSAGCVYIAGYTDSIDFPLATLGPLPAGANHAFVAKLDASGSALVYADYIGGNAQDWGYALVLDAQNNVYVTGQTESSDFPVINPYQAALAGSANVFLTKISVDGSGLLYSTYLGGNGWDQPSGVGIDELGQVYVAGTTSSTNFPVANAYQPAVFPNQAGLYGVYGFLTKFAPDGSSLVYSTFLGGNSNVARTCSQGSCWPAPFSLITGVAVDANDNAYVAGNTNTYNFPVTSGAYLTTDSAPQNAMVGFVTKFDSSGSLGYSTYFYGASGASAEIAAIAVDSSGSAYVTGQAPSDGTFPVTSTSICDPSVSFGGCSYAFVTKFDPTGATLSYSTFLGLYNVAFPQAIALDQNNDAYVLSVTWGSSFALANGIEAYTNGSDLLLVEIDPIASTQLFATYLGGTGDEFPAGLAVDAGGNLYVAGQTLSSDFPVVPSAFQTTPGGNADAFVLKIGPSAAPAYSVSPSLLQYSTQQVGSTSQPQTVLLRNMGSASMSISSITTNGDFAQTNNCGTSVPAAGSCTFSVTFTPTAVGLRSGAVVIQDDAAGAPHVINLSGEGSGAVVALSPASLSFPSSQVGTTSGAQAVTLTNNGNATLSISAIQVAGNYSQTNNCPATLPSGASCAINITFSPTSAGARNGTLSISDSASDSPQALSLTGTGADFSLASSPSSETVGAGSKATYTLTVAPLGGAFTNAVNLSCSAPAQAACNFSTNAVTPGGNAATVTITITTGVLARATPPQPLRSNPVYAGWFQLQGLGLFGMILAGSRSRTNKLRVRVLLALGIAALILMPACTGVSSIEPQTGTTIAPGTYTISVSGASGTLQHSLGLSLTIN